VALGIQRVLAMFAGTMLGPLLMASMPMSPS
jgi:xanthine/uracil permease